MCDSVVRCVTVQGLKRGYAFGSGEKNAELCVPNGTTVYLLLSPLTCAPAKTFFVSSKATVTSALVACACWSCSFCSFSNPSRQPRLGIMLGCRCRRGFSPRSTACSSSSLIFRSAKEGRSLGSISQQSLITWEAEEEKKVRRARECRMGVYPACRGRVSSYVMESLGTLWRFGHSVALL